ncbi:hypothetical protein RCH08_003514 [Janthinobacterium sp. CG_S6]|nr:hypothetical protein [Janthinobacterium sp. CG_S6]
MQNAPEPEPALSTSFPLCRGGQLAYALPLRHARDTPRPLPLEALAAMPASMLDRAPASVWQSRVAEPAV